MSMAPAVVYSLPVASGEDQEMDRAAAKLQAIQRGRTARKETEKKHKRSFFRRSKDPGQVLAANDAQRLEAYKRLAQQKATAAKEAAEIRKLRKQGETNRLPPGVWWGFHYFWPKDLLTGEQKDKDPLDDPAFVDAVVRLMGDEQVIAAFARVDRSGSGRIDNKSELESLVKMCLPNPQPVRSRFTSRSSSAQVGQRDARRAHIRSSPPMPCIGVPDCNHGRMRLRSDSACPLDPSPMLPCRLSYLSTLPSRPAACRARLHT